jgi:hypothetical protein
MTGMFQDDNRLYAYEVFEGSGMPITTGALTRAWMDSAPARAPYRCLPLAIANQAGWMVHNPTDFTAIWDGGESPECLRLAFGFDPVEPSADALGWTFVAAPFIAPPVRPDPRIGNKFGSGILTFSIPYLFRTPRGVNLWVKGPTNYIKDGAHPLEGIVETDWSAATFTMNWKLTRPNHPVRFERGEPICMIVPLARGLAEALQPVQLPLSRNPELEQEYQAWSRSRWEFLADLAGARPEALERGWQRDYTKGMTATGTPAPEHQTRLDLKEFTRE